MLITSWIALWVLTAMVIAGVAYLLPGVQVKNFGTALVVAVVLGLLNVFVRPIIAFFSFPITVVTLGLFAFVINALIILLASAIVPNFKVNGFGNALLFSLIITFLRVLLGGFFAA